jgi:hypothetical protein
VGFPYGGELADLIEGKTSAIAASISARDGFPRPPSRAFSRKGRDFLDVAYEVPLGRKHGINDKAQIIFGEISEVHTSNGEQISLG